MEKDEKLKLMFEKSTESHHYFLNWRYSLFAGYITIISVLGYFILNSDDFYFRLIGSFAGLTIALFFGFIHFRITDVYRKCEQSAKEIEDELGFGKDDEIISIGLYHHLHPYDNFKNKSNGGYDDQSNLPKKENEKGNCIKWCDKWINPMFHTGAINLFILITGLAFLFLPFWSAKNQDTQKKSTIENTYIFNNPSE